VHAIVQGAGPSASAPPQNLAQTLARLPSGDELKCVHSTPEPGRSADAATLWQAITRALGERLTATDATALGAAWQAYHATRGDWIAWSAGRGKRDERAPPHVAIETAAGRPALEALFSAVAGSAYLKEPAHIVGARQVAPLAPLPGATDALWLWSRAARNPKVSSEQGIASRISNNGDAVRLWLAPNIRAPIAAAGASTGPRQPAGAVAADAGVPPVDVTDAGSDARSGDAPPRDLTPDFGTWGTAAAGACVLNLPGNATVTASTADGARMLFTYGVNGDTRWAHASLSLPMLKMMLRLAME
jgi:hypothetical protein